MKRHVASGLPILVTVMVIGFYGGCTSAKFKPTTPGPRVPYISNFRIEPPVVESGGQATLRFDFRDIDGNIMDVYISLKREVSDFTVATGLESQLISQGRYLGQTEGTAMETITISIERPLASPGTQARGFQGGARDPDTQLEQIGGTRVYTVFVVDTNGHVSNHLQARVTVR